ncbi:MAG TPA: type 2 isopentenyl-diphosphate Delta-isomerase [Methanoregulaceae archaeon]|jgi:isopentenyl-diphosphate delta-isomerase|nr:type 2 isopentenyl-diphosphate Delta-isomerase [Methanolinea sp.]MCC7566792.1 type 2 isopentenyl-diphosphate Delta-isomerase [Methanoregulaceae archaeon]MDD3091214.1 type 2 isopentenyl-diphosphate Delta-isomerase [Methanoregulaceae archaeon]MDD5047327.1 type 2 isopentenyl-diphosphate Delta-isomerase [Methanoregulaceae archaeon]MDD5684167.1 type 2 isopentenyl-diphosphate Delta-isomerase [Methanoregulaceae archaeon]
MTNKEKLTPVRKLDHIRICLEEEIERGWPGFDEVHLSHCALPECNLDELTTKTTFLGHDFESPLFIAGMTGGHPETKEINRRLARAAERFGIGMGVGSQRAALVDSALEDTFSVVREEAPHAFLAANLGIVQLREHGLEWVERAVEMIDANAIAIHLNFLQEAIQPEGDHDATGCTDALASLCRDFDLPVIVKETGSGISAETARVCWNAGVSAIDVGGWGGTSWAAIEGLRAAARGESGLARLGEVFEEWGIPTVVSICEAASTGGPIIATGGIRTGLHMAKAMTLGADLSGMALTLLPPAIEGEEALFQKIGEINHEFRVAMFLSGSRTPAELCSTRAYFTGTIREMLEHEGGI